MAVDPFRGYTCTAATVDEAVILEIWSPRIQELALRLARNFRLGSGAEEDLAQEARLRVLQVARGGRPLVPPYVWKVIKNSMWSALKRDRLNRESESALLDGTDQLNPESFVYQPSSDGILVRRIETLPRRLREVYHLLYVEGLTQQEASVRLDISQARIAQLKQVLLARVRALLAKR